MWRFILAVIVLATAIAVIKLATLALIVAGLIFRPVTTVGLLIAAGLLALMHAQPVLGLGAVVAFVVVAVTLRKREAANLSETQS